MYIICVIKLLPLRLRQEAGGLLSQVPSSWQVKTGAPTNSYPSLQAKVAVSPSELPEGDTATFACNDGYELQAKVAVSPSELPDCDTTPLAGLLASGHRAVQNGENTIAIVVKAIGDLKLTHVYRLENCYPRFHHSGS